MQAFEMICSRRLLNSSFKDHVTNEGVHRKIQAAIGEYDELLTLVKKQKLRWFCHISRSSVVRDCCKFICGAPTTFQCYGIE